MHNLVLNLLQHLTLTWISESSVFTYQAVLDGDAQSYNSFHKQDEMYEINLL